VVSTGDGRTAAELEDEIRSRLQEKFMHDPQVSVFIHEHNSQRVSSSGGPPRRGVPAEPAASRRDALALARTVEDADSFV